jgi:hypothetical protein
VQSQLQLSYLCLGGFCITDTEAAAVATITGLQELELHNAPELTPYGIKHLTEACTAAIHGTKHYRHSL